MVNVGTIFFQMFREKHHSPHIKVVTLNVFVSEHASDIFQLHESITEYHYFHINYLKIYLVRQNFKCIFFRFYGFGLEPLSFVHLVG